MNPGEIKWFAEGFKARKTMGQDLNLNSLTQS